MGYRKFNSKRQVMPKSHYNQSKLDELLACVRYRGNAEHKKDPRNFGFISPPKPRRDKSLCDDTDISSTDDALKHIKEGLKRGIVCKRWIKGWPRHIWSVTDDGNTVLEAKRDGEGSYHAYPLPENDPVAKEVLKRWN